MALQRSDSLWSLQTVCLRYELEICIRAAQCGPNKLYDHRTGNFSFCFARAYSSSTRSIGRSRISDTATTLTSLNWLDLVQIRVQCVSSMQYGRSLHITVHPKCWSRTTGLNSCVGSSERSRSYGTLSMSRPVHDTHRPMDKLNEPLEP